MDAARLKDVPLFAGLTKHELQEVARHTDEVDLKEGKQLVTEGDFSYEFFAIEEGTAEVTHDGQVLAELGPGDFFGEMGVVDNTTRNATVTVTSPMTAIVITAVDFRRMAREVPGVAQAVHKAIAERGRKLGDG